MGQRSGSHSACTMSGWTQWRIELHVLKVLCKHLYSQHGCELASRILLLGIVESRMKLLTNGQRESMANAGLVLYVGVLAPDMSSAIFKILRKVLRKPAGRSWNKSWWATSEYHHINVMNAVSRSPWLDTTEARQLWSYTMYILYFVIFSNVDFHYLNDVGTFWAC